MIIVLPDIYGTIIILNIGLHRTIFLGSLLTNCVRIETIYYTYYNWRFNWQLVADPVYQSSKIFSGGLIAVHSVNSKLKLNRPVYNGQAVQDLIKYLMYRSILSTVTTALPTYVSVDLNCIPPSWSQQTLKMCHWLM